MDILCPVCIEQRLGHKIYISDLKEGKFRYGVYIPHVICNIFYLRKHHPILWLRETVKEKIMDIFDSILG
jgi:hypothetical protein